MDKILKWEDDNVRYKYSLNIGKIEPKTKDVMEKEKELLELFITWYNAKPKQDKT